MTALISTVKKSVGAKTLSTTTLRIMTLATMKVGLIVVTFSVTALSSIIGRIETLNTNYTLHKS